MLNFVFIFSKIALDGNAISASEIVESSSSGYSYASFTGLNMADGKYTVSVIGINEVKMYSQKTSDIFHLVTIQPSLTGQCYNICVKKLYL